VSNAQKPSSEPPEDEKNAIPTLFQPSHPKVFLIARASSCSSTSIGERSTMV
jgi:hypothetical protein